MKGKTLKDIPWLQQPSSSLIDSLVTCGLVTPNTKVTKAPKHQSNLKPVPSNYSALDPFQTKKNKILSPPKTPIVNKSINQTRAKTATLAKRQSIDHPRANSSNNNKKGNNSSISQTRDINSFLTPADDPEKDKNNPQNETNSMTSDNLRLPNIDEYISTERKFAGRKEAQELTSNYHYLLSTLHLDDYSDADQLTEAVKRSLDFTLLTFNKLILQIRGYSEDHAKLLNEIKSYYVRRVEQLPEMCEIYANQLHEASEKQESLEKQEIRLNHEIEDRDRSIVSLQNEIEMQRKDYEKLNFMLQETQEKLNMALLENAQYEDDKKTLMFKLAKTEDAKNQAQQTATANEEMLENTRAQIKSQEALLEKYQQEGAGFRPLYLKATDENSKLKDQIEELKTKIEKMVEKQQTKDCEVQTDPVTIVPTKTEKDTASKKSKRSRIGTLKRGPAPPLFDNNELQSKNKPEFANTISLHDQLPKLADKSSIFLMEKRSPSLSDLVTRNRNSENSSGQSTAEPSTPSSKGSSELQTIPEEQSIKSNPVPFPHTKNNQIQQNASDVTGTKQNNDLNNTQTNPPPNTKIESIKPSQSKLELQLKQKENNLPADYHISHNNIEATPTLISCIYRLLPLQLNMSLSLSPSFRIDTILQKTKTHPKEYFWVLHHIVDFFHTLYSMEQITDSEIDIVALFRNALIESTQMEVLANKIFTDIVQSSQFYKLTSSCVQFFLQFLLQELTIVDFKFFNIIFNICFEYIYPPIIQIIEDPEFLPEQPQFLIHVDVCKFLYELLFKPYSNTINYDDLRKNTKLTVHPDLVDFFVFSTKMIQLFRQLHQQFHGQVENILMLVGWSQLVDMSESLFKDFFVIVDPLSSKSDIDKLWQRFKLELSIHDHNMNITQASFIQFCSDFPEVSNKILILPFLANFNRSFSSLPSPLQELFTYIKKKFTKLVRDIYRSVASDMKKAFERIIVKIRNSLLRCDVSTSLISYRHFLQLTDLKITELSPFVVFLPQTTNDDVNLIITMLHSREMLAIHALGKDYKGEPLGTIEETVQSPENSKEQNEENEENVTNDNSDNVCEILPEQDTENPQEV